MKALTLLKYLHSGAELGMPSLDKINEAIKELEELNNKSCWDCKHWCQEFQAVGICCKGVKEEKQFRETMTYNNFSCNKWERK